MRIYLAGGVNGNLKPLFREIVGGGDMRVYLAGGTGRYDIIAEIINESLFGNTSYLRGRDSCERGGIPDAPYILESFYYCDEVVEKMIPHFGDFMLDSGAFSFMENPKIKHDWDEYVERYADFINRNNVKKFFELDIDSIIGYDKVLKLRERLERLTGKKCIPVWHTSRGKEEFLKMCEDYDYVSVGGIVGKEWRADEYIPWFIREAHKRGAKIHGLGYTKLSKLKDMHFDSVDSTSWTGGNRFGYIYKFENGEMKKIDVPAGHRLANPREVALINFKEWVKFQKWAERNL